MVTSVVAVLGRRAGALELGILAHAFGLDRSDEDLPRHEFAVCAVQPGTVPTTSGFAVQATHDLALAADTADIVAVPAWPDLDRPLDPTVREALRSAAARGARMFSICTGAFALASAGLLDGRRATTHWQLAGRFARAYPAVDLDRDVLYVDDGQYLTSAGAAAGIDACLHQLSLLHGSAIANAVARRWVAPPQRQGGQAQYVELPLPRHPDDRTIAPLLDWIATHLDEPHTVASLARRSATSPRTFTRRFAEVTGTTPGRWVTAERVRRAASLLESTDADIEAIAHACGFGAADTLRHHFARQHATTPTSYRRAFRSTDGSQGPVSTGREGSATHSLHEPG